MPKQAPHTASKTLDARVPRTLAAGLAEPLNIKRSSPTVSPVFCFLNPARRPTANACKQSVKRPIALGPLPANVEDADTSIPWPSVYRSPVATII